MSALDTKKVWETLMNDPGFTSQMPTQAHGPMKELVEALPKVLEPHLGKPLTVQSLLETTIAVIEYELETGFVPKLTAALPEESLPFSAARVNVMVIDVLGRLANILREATKDVPAFLEAQGVEERAFLGHPKGGRLDASSLKAYDAGTLTVQGLLESQPAIFIQLNNS